MLIDLGWSSAGLQCTHVYDIDVFALSTGTALSIGFHPEFFGWPSSNACGALHSLGEGRGGCLTPRRVQYCSQ